MTKAAFRVLLFVSVVIGIGLAIVYRDVFSAQMLEDLVSRFGQASPLVFIGLYSIATVLFLPGSVITLVGGALFGPLWGVLYNLTGATIGATAAFMISRYLAADWVEKKSGPRVRHLKTGVEAEGWRFVAFVRLVPLFPFNLLNYAMGLTRIQISHYVVTTYIAMLPGAVAYTYLGYAGREMIAGGEGLVQKGLLAFALMALAIFLPGLIRRLRQKPMLEVNDLNIRLESGEAPLILDVRSPEEFVGKQGHIDQALNIPLDVLEDRVGELIPFMDEPVVIVCCTHVRSAKAARLLTARGFTDLSVVHNGMTAWISAKFSVVRD
tara:strand:+ start:104 stop:1072 length:969 start_codon:yes stop_codon:yes gene_type:complete